MQCAQEDESWSEGAIYLSLLAASQFEDQQGRKPGETPDPRDTSWEHDIKQLSQLTATLWQETGLHMPCIVSEDLLTEVCRSAGGRMHCMGAILGGCAAQEAIKVLLRQFVPVGGVLVYDGAPGSSKVLEL